MPALCSLSSAGCASGARRRWGEEFVFLLLKSKYKRHNCRWVNRHGESGRPYDLTLQRSDTAGGGSDDDDDGDDGDDGPGGGGGDGLVYVEVKSTTQGPEDAEGPFPISLPELLFAAQRKVAAIMVKPFDQTLLAAMEMLYIKETVVGVRDGAPPHRTGRCTHTDHHIQDATAPFCSPACDMIIKTQATPLWSARR